MLGINGGIATCELICKKPCISPLSNLHAQFYSEGNLLHYPSADLIRMLRVDSLPLPSLLPPSHTPLSAYADSGTESAADPACCLAFSSSDDAMALHNSEVEKFFGCGAVMSAISGEAEQPGVDPSLVLPNVLPGNKEAISQTPTVSHEEDQSPLGDLVFDIAPPTPFMDKTDTEDNSMEQVEEDESGQSTREAVDISSVGAEPPELGTRLADSTYTDVTVVRRAT